MPQRQKSRGGELGSEDDDGLPRLGLGGGIGGDAKGLKRDFAKLVNYAPCSEIDRKLLFGILGIGQVSKEYQNDEGIKEYRDEY